MIYTAIQILQKAKTEKLNAIEKWQDDKTMQSVVEILQNQVNEIICALVFLEHMER